MGIVGFHLAEIGIDGDIEREAIVNDRLGVDAAAWIGAAAKGGNAVGRVVQEVRTAEGDVGDELQIAAGRDVEDSAEAER